MQLLRSSQRGAARREVQRRREGGAERAARAACRGCSTQFGALCGMCGTERGGSARGSGGQRAACAVREESRRAERAGGGLWTSAAEHGYSAEQITMHSVEQSVCRAWRAGARGSGGQRAARAGDRSALFVQRRAWASWRWRTFGPGAHERAGGPASSVHSTWLVRHWV